MTEGEVPDIPADAFLAFAGSPPPVVIAPDNFLKLPDGVYLFTPARIKEAWSQCWKLLDELVRQNKCERVVALCGLPATGKTTWVRQNHARYGPRTVFFDDLFLTSVKRKMWWEGFKRAGLCQSTVPVEIVVISVDFELVQRNLDARVSAGGHGVPSQVLKRFRDEFEPPMLDEGFQKVSLLSNTFDQETKLGGFELKMAFDRAAPPPMLEGAPERFIREKLTCALTPCLVDLAREKPSAPVEWLAARLRQYNASLLSPAGRPPSASSAEAAGRSGAGGGPMSEKLSSKKPPPREAFEALVAAGRVVVCEYNGPYRLDAFHSNVAGQHYGYCDVATFDKHLAAMQDSMRLQTSWSELDCYVKNFAPEYAFNFGQIRGQRIDMAAVRPIVRKAQDRMTEDYKKALDGERSKPGGEELLHELKEIKGPDGFEERWCRLSAAPPSRGSKRDVLRGSRRDVASLPKPNFLASPSGVMGEKPTHRDVHDLASLCAGALTAIGPLWDRSMRVRAATSEPDAEVTWGLKRPKRIRFKLYNKYKNKCERVTDCARTSITFRSMAALKQATQFLLEQPTTVGFKNRFASPTEEAYSDMLLLSDVDGYICEVQLHLYAMAEAKKGTTGHTMYKLVPPRTSHWPSTAFHGLPRAVH